MAVNFWRLHIREFVRLMIALHYPEKIQRLNTEADVIYVKEHC